MSGPEKDDEVVELLTWDASDGTEEDEEDELEEELPADEAFEPEEDADEESEDAVALEEVVADGFAKKGPANIPQPGRAKSHPDLPRVKSTSFKRFIS
jgi:hypothetical protein